MDEGKKKKKRKKKHRRSKKTGSPELKVTTRGEGADTPVWTRAGPDRDSSSTSDSQLDSGLGSNPSFQPRWDADNEPQRGTLVTPLPSPDPPRESPDDDPLSDLGEGDGDQEMLDADKLPGIQDPVDPGAAPSEEPEGAQPDGDQEEAGDGGEPQEPEEHLEPYQIILQGFRTISQTLSAAYGAASAEIQILIQKSLAKTTTEDWTFVWGASGAIHHWLDSVRPAMAAMGENTNEQAKLLEAAQQAGKDALDSILELIAEEQEPQLTPVFPKATRLLAPALAVARWYTNEALRNIHSQLADLAREHMSEEQAGTLFNTILQVTCSFRQEMDNMATNQVFLPSQIVPNLWGSRRGLFEGLSLMGPPNCLASWPASLVEWVTAVPACQNVLGSSQTPTKANLPSSGAMKTTPDSGKKPHQSTKQVARAFWGDEARRKEDAEARKLEEKCRKKSTGPLLSLGDHEDSIATLLKWAPASWISQPPSDVSGSGSKCREKVQGKPPPAYPLDDEPLSDRADEPKAKNCKQDPTPDLVILEDDDSTPHRGSPRVQERKPIPRTRMRKPSMHCRSV